MIQFDQTGQPCWDNDDGIFLAQDKGLKKSKILNLQTITCKKVKAWTHLHFSNIPTHRTWHVGATGCNGLCVQYSRVCIYLCSKYLLRGALRALCCSQASARLISQGMKPAEIGDTDRDLCRGQYLS